MNPDNEQLQEHLEKWLMAMELRIGDNIARKVNSHTDQTETRILDRLEGLEKRIQLQGGLLQSGNRAVTRLADWSVDTDTEILRYGSRIDDLERRLAKLEGAA